MKCGGCKSEVARLWKHPRLEAAGFPDGLCVTCYQIEKDTWARDDKAPQTEPLAPRQKRKYIRRAAVPGAEPVRQKRQYKRRAVAGGPRSGVDQVREIREQWAAKLAAAEKDVLLFQCRLDVVDEVLALIGEPPSRGQARLT